MITMRTPLRNFYLYNMSGKQYYRLSPILWDNVPGKYTATVYGIDRMPDGPLAQYVRCCSRCKDDPSYTWAGSTYFRLVMPPGLGSCCNGPQNIGDAVVWATLPTWLTWAESQGYTLADSIDKIDPLRDFTLIY
jgi:hypothetical protein